MFRRILSICLTVLLLFGLLPIGNVSAQGSNDYDMTASVEGGTIYFNSSTQSVVGGTVSGNLVIPSHINGIPVRSIGKLAFQGNWGTLLSVTLPEGLVTIEGGAFNHCFDLHTVNLPSTLERIGNMAFYKTVLKKIELPDAIRYIGENAFGCTSPEALVLPEVPLFLGAGAFSECYTIKEVVIHESVVLSERVFSHCGGLQKVVLPDNLTVLPARLFEECGRLETINLPSGLETIGDRCFYKCDMLKQIVLPSTLKTIGEQSFAKCRLLEEIQLPEGLRVIGQEAFRDSPIKELTLPTSLEKLGSGAFLGTALPFESRTSGTYFQGWMLHSKAPAYPASADVSVDEGTIGIADKALNKTLSETLLRSFAVTLPSTVKYIYADCFQDENGRNKVGAVTVHPDNPYICAVDNILYSKDMTSLIFCGAFVYRPTIKLPQTLRKIEDKAFYNCDMLTSIVLPDGVEEIGAYGLSTPYLREVTLSKNLRSIGDYAFQGCYQLRSIVFHDALEHIGDYAFCGNVDMYQVYFSKNIRSIGDYAFTAAPLQHLPLGDKVETIGDYAFCGASLRYVNLGASIRSIGEQAFSGNAELKDIVFAATLEELGDSAFYDCVGLERAIFHGAVPKMGENVFYYQHRYPETGRVENKPLPKLTIYYSNQELWDPEAAPAATYWEKAPKTIYLDVNKADWYAEAVEYTSACNLMNGVGLGKFDPEGTMTRAMVVTVLWRLQGAPVLEKAHSFTDVSDTEWYAEAVNWAFANQIANGTAETTFEPEASVTREQLATFLYRYAAFSSSEALPEGALPDFPDKGSVTDYAIAPFAWACGEGLINGVKEESNTYLRPQSSATRAQVATILMRYIEKNL